MMVVIDPLFFLAAIPAVLLTGISKGGFGSALGGVGVPIMALVISPVHAAAILLPVLCFMDLVGFRVYYRKWDMANLKIMIPGATIGIAIGALTFGVLPEDAIRILIGAIAVAFPLKSWIKVEEKNAPAPTSRLKGTFWSSVSGWTSFIAHAGGPPAMIYMLPQRLDKTRYVATISAFFMFVNFTKLLPYAWLGQLSAANLATSLMLAPLVPVGVWIGLRLQERVNVKWFYRISQSCLFVTGLQLIYQGVRKLL